MAGALHFVGFACIFVCPTYKFIYFINKVHCTHTVESRLIQTWNICAMYTIFIFIWKAVRNERVKKPGGIGCCVCRCKYSMHVPFAGFCRRFLCFFSRNMLTKKCAVVCTAFDVFTDLFSAARLTLHSQCVSICVDYSFMHKQDSFTLIVHDIHTCCFFCCSYVIHVCRQVFRLGFFFAIVARIPPAIDVWRMHRCAHMEPGVK